METDSQCIYYVIYKYETFFLFTWSYGNAIEGMGEQGKLWKYEALASLSEVARVQILQNSTGVSEPYPEKVKQVCVSSMKKEGGRGSLRVIIVVFMESK